MALEYIAILGTIYLVPTFVAFMRGHRNAMPIFVINLLLGWTLLGWVAALAWSVAAQTPASTQSD